MTAWSGHSHLTVREVKWSCQGWAWGGAGAVELAVVGAEFQLGRRKALGMDVVTAASTTVSVPKATDMLTRCG